MIEPVSDALTRWILPARSANAPNLDQLGDVAEGCVEQAADRSAEVGREVVGGAADVSRERDDRKNEHARKIAVCLSGARNSRANAAVKAQTRRAGAPYRSSHERTCPRACNGSASIYSWECAQR